MKVSNIVSYGLVSGQQNYPETSLVERYFEGIFDRQHYTESGPLVQELEAAINQAVGAKHVVCVSNPAIAWLMLLEAESLGGKNLLIPASMPKPLFEAISWLRCSSQLYCDDLKSWYQSPKFSSMKTLTKIDAVIGINRWGGACDIDDFLSQAERENVRVYFDSSESFACEFNGQPVGSFGKAEVFSFDHKNLIYGDNAACICTNDELLADQLRCMRSSGGVIRKVPISKTVNGRMSEAQAAYALMGLERLDYWISRNYEQHKLYVSSLSGKTGANVISAHGVTKSNYQNTIVYLNSKVAGDALLKKIREEDHTVISALSRIVSDEYNSSKDCGATADLCLSLPLGSRIDLQSIQKIANILSAEIS